MNIYYFSDIDSQVSGIPIPNDFIDHTINSLNKSNLNLMSDNKIKNLPFTELDILNVGSDFRKGNLNPPSLYYNNHEINNLLSSIFENELPNVLSAEEVEKS